MHTIKTFRSEFGAGPVQFSLPGLRLACESLGLSVWSQGAAWGFDRQTILGRRERVIRGAYDPRDADDERQALQNILATTRKGRRLLKRSLAAAE